MAKTYIDWASCKAVNGQFWEFFNISFNVEKIQQYANEKGYVAYPDINPVIEMVDLIEAMRSYEANVTAFNTHRGIDTKTLDILAGN